jgi:hypothetical protein
MRRTGYTLAKSTFGLWHTLVKMVIFFGFWLLGGSDCLKRQQRHTN